MGWTHVELQALGPLANPTVAPPTLVVPLVLKEVVASGGVTLPVEAHPGPATSCPHSSQSERSRVSPDGRGRTTSISEH